MLTVFVRGGKLGGGGGQFRTMRFIGCLEGLHDPFAFISHTISQVFAIERHYSTTSRNLCQPGKFILAVSQV